MITTMTPTRALISRSLGGTSTCRIQFKEAGVPSAIISSQDLPKNIYRGLGVYLGPQFEQLVSVPHPHLEGEEDRLKGMSPDPHIMHIAKIFWQRHEAGDYENMETIWKA